MRIFLPGWIRKFFRRLVRQILRYGPQSLKRLAVRVLFSRFHGVPSHLFWGEELIVWRDVNILVNPGENTGYYHYFLGDYAKEEVDLLARLGKNFRLFADVGANVGYMSLALARTCPFLKIYAFEPNGSILERFSKHLTLNKDLSNRIVLVERAVADVNAHLFFQPSTKSHDIEVGRLVDAEASPAVFPVNTIRLDTFFEKLGEYPEMVKIDVEGAELRVLEGMSTMFSKGFPKTILVEVHGSYFGDDSLAFKRNVKSILEKSGYHLSSLGSNGIVECDKPEFWPQRLHVLAIKM